MRACPRAPDGPVARHGRAGTRQVSGGEPPGTCGVPRRRRVDRRVILPDVLAPDTVMAGKYVIVGPLDSGGMGDVYDAWQKDLSRPVAIKLLRADILGDETMFRRFRREAEAAASLGHPNIVQVLDFRNDPDEQPMLIMEKLEGRSLRSLLAEEKPLAPQRATFIALQILSALAAAHHPLAGRRFQKRKRA